MLIIKFIINFFSGKNTNGPIIWLHHVEPDILAKTKSIFFIKC